MFSSLQHLAVWSLDYKISAWNRWNYTWDIRWFSPSSGPKETARLWQRTVTRWTWCTGMKTIISWPTWMRRWRVRQVIWSTATCDTHRGGIKNILVVIKLVGTMIQIIKTLISTSQSHKLSYGKVLILAWMQTNSNHPDARDLEDHMWVKIGGITFSWWSHWKKQYFIC